MLRVDFARATGVAIAILVLNLIAAILAVVFYSIFIEPGHSTEFHEDAALWISLWSCRIVGTSLFFGVAFRASRRRRDQSGLRFAVTFVLIYFVIDAATVGFAGVFELQFAVSMLGNLGAASAGALVGRRRQKGFGEVK